MVKRTYNHGVKYGKLKMNFTHAITYICSILLAGCSSETVIVVDGMGKPIEGAIISGASLSMNTKEVETNAKGEATVPSNIQSVKWVLIEKSGYQSVHVDVPLSWPLHIILKKND